MTCYLMVPKCICCVYLRLFPIDSAVTINIADNNSVDTWVTGIHKLCCPQAGVVLRLSYTLITTSDQANVTCVCPLSMH